MEFNGNKTVCLVSVKQIIWAEGHFGWFNRQPSNLPQLHNYLTEQCTGYYDFRRNEHRIPKQINLIILNEKKGKNWINKYCFTRVCM